MEVEKAFVALYKRIWVSISVNGNSNNFTDAQIELIYPMLPPCPTPFNVWMQQVGGVDALEAQKKEEEPIEDGPGFMVAKTPEDHARIEKWIEELERKREQHPTVQKEIQIAKAQAE